MISNSIGGTSATCRVVPAGALRALRRRGRLPQTVVVLGTAGAEIPVRTAETAAGYGGRRPWFICPACERRIGTLIVFADDARCRQCARLPYESRRSRGSPWWRLWGQAVWKLARVRAELSRRYLRLARRGELERLAKQLVEEVCSGLSADRSAELRWEKTGSTWHWFGVPPYGLGYDWDDEAGGVVPIV